MATSSRPLRVVNDLIPCGLCGKEIDDDILGGCPLLIISETAGVCFHAQCWDSFQPRILNIPLRTSDGKSVIDAIEDGEIEGEWYR